MAFIISGNTVSTPSGPAGGDLSGSYPNPSVTHAASATTATSASSAATSDKTNALNSATTIVNVSAATAPTAGQVLTATSGTAAIWQTPSGGGGSSFSGASIYLTSPQNVSGGGGETQAIWDTAAYDVGGYFGGVGPGAFQVPTSGYYLIQCTIHWDRDETLTGDKFMHLIVQGADTVPIASDLSPNGGVALNQFFSTIIHLNANDIVSVNVSCASSFANIKANEGGLTITKVGS